jgi:hypothetical protein
MKGPVDLSSVERAEPRIGVTMKSVLSISVICFASQLGAQELVLTDQTEYYQKDMSNRHTSCQKEALEILSENFDTAKSLEIKTSNYWQSVVNDVENYAFPDSIITTDEGNIQTDILCLVHAPQNTIVEVSFQFNPGLANNRSSGRPTSMFASQRKTLVTGDS